MRKPTRVATRTAGTYPFFRLKEHTLAQESAPERTVVTFEMPDWVTVVAVTDGGEVVLVRQHRHGIDDATLETPGGIVDPGEDPAETARRELREETGFAARAVEPLGWVHSNPALQDNRCHAFLALGVTRAGEPEHDPAEHTEPMLLSLDEVREAMRDGRITHALVVLALQLGLERIGRPTPPREPTAREPTAREPTAREMVDRILSLLDAIEATQHAKVVDLARRLKPGLTAEDIRNPHDFPELGDPDWHYEDGQLTGVQSVRFAIRTLSRDVLGDGDEAGEEGAEAP